MAAKFKITDLGTLENGNFSSAKGINDFNQIVGISNRGPKDESSDAVAFFKGYDGLTELSPFEPPAFQTCAALAINNQGKVCGQAGNPGFGSWDHACLWSYGAAIDLESAGHARAINDHNQVLVTGWQGDKVEIWESSGFREILIAENIDFCVAVYGRGLNEFGQIVGKAHIGEGDIAYLWEMGSFYDLNEPGYSLGTLVSAEDINDNGVIVGEFKVKETISKPFVLLNGELTDLGSIGFDNHKATKINQKAQIIGQGYQPNISRDEYAAFFWQKNEITKIDDLLTSLDSGWRVVEANDINDQGQIVGTGIYGGQRRAILLDPH